MSSVPPIVAHLLQDPRRADEITAGAIPSVLAELERLRVTLWARLIHILSAQRQPRVEDDPRAGVRCLRPKEAAELTGLEEAYIQALCRTAKLPAFKSGKYWLIPVEGFRQWQERQGLDKERSASLLPESGSRRGTTDAPAARAHASPIRQARRRSRRHGG